MTIFGLRIKTKDDYSTYEKCRYLINSFVKAAIIANWDYDDIDKEGDPLLSTQLLIDKLFNRNSLGSNLSRWHGRIYLALKDYYFYFYFNESDNDYTGITKKVFDDFDEMNTSLRDEGVESEFGWFDV